MHSAPWRQDNIPDDDARPDPFRSHPGYLFLKRRKAAVDRAGLPLPYFRAHEGLNGSEVMIEGRRRVNFSGYDYLGLSAHPEVIAAAKAGIDRFGTSVSASRIVSGEIPPHRQLERELAEALTVEDCAVFISGWGTNVSTIGHLMGRRDLILTDAECHNSIQLGARISGSRTMTFRHNDPDDLDRLLTRHRPDHERVLIVVEGAYSMDGDIADLPRLIEIKRRHDALLMVDEAHSLGVLGDRGLGVRDHFGLAGDDIDVWMGTLSKSLAASGGYIAGSAALIEYLKYTSPGFLFSVGLPPADTHAALAALRILKREPERVATLRTRARLFIDLAREHGLNTGMSEGTSVVPVILGAPELCLRLSAALFEEDIAVYPIIPPGVSVSNSRLRFFINATHDEDQIARAVAATARLMAKAADGKPETRHP